jgi:hypothetical protein
MRLDDAAAKVTKPKRPERSGRQTSAERTAQEIYLDQVDLIASTFRVPQRLIERRVCELRRRRLQRLSFLGLRARRDCSICNP